MSGEGGLVLTPVCGDIELLDIWSQGLPHPHPSGGSHSPVRWFLPFKSVVFTIGIEGKVSSCSGEILKIPEHQTCASDLWSKAKTIALVTQRSTPVLRKVRKICIVFFFPLRIVSIYTNVNPPVGYHADRKLV